MTVNARSAVGHVARLLDHGIDLLGQDVGLTVEIDGILIGHAVQTVNIRVEIVVRGEQLVQLGVLIVHGPGEIIKGVKHVVGLPAGPIDDRVVDEITLCLRPFGGPCGINDHLIDRGRAAGGRKRHICDRVLFGPVDIKRVGPANGIPGLKAVGEDRIRIRHRHPYTLRSRLPRFKDRHPGKRHGVDRHETHDGHRRNKLSECAFRSASHTR